MAHDYSPCPLAPVHRRLSDAHVALHELEASYFDPEGFRRSLNALIQALRNVTWILQKNKASIPRFDEWYSPWQDAMRKSVVLRWLCDARTRVVHRGDLETYSRARVALVASYIRPKTVEFDVPPWSTAEAIALTVESRIDVPEKVRDISVVRVERRWVDSELPEYEILDAVHYVLSFLVAILDSAHEQLVTTGEVELPPIAPPDYRQSTEEHRTAHLRLKDMTFATVESVQREPTLDRADEAIARYGIQFTDEQREQGSEEPGLRRTAARFFDIARVVLQKDGYHRNFAMLVGPSGASLVRVDARDKAEKFLIWRRVAEQVKERRASTVIVIGEMWQAEGAEAPEVFNVEDMQNKSEILGLQAISIDGDFIQMFAPIKRSKDDSIVLGETQESHGDRAMPSFLTPIFDVWDETRRT
jgi:hypothetical protein